MYDNSVQQAPFHTSSAGLGLQWCLDNKDQLVKDLHIKNGKTKLSIPRYYREKLGIDTSSLEFVEQIEKGVDKLVDVLYDNGCEKVWLDDISIREGRLLRKQGQHLNGRPITAQAFALLRRLRVHHDRMLYSKYLTKKDDKL